MTALAPPDGLVRNQSTFAVFVCTVTGFPRPHVSWTRKYPTFNSTAQVLQEKRNKILLRNSVVSDSTGLVTVTSTIAILNLTIEDSQMYICTGENLFNITNHLGASEMASTSLSVQRKIFVCIFIISPCIVTALFVIFILQCLLMLLHSPA